MRVAVVHNAVADNAAPEQRDVLLQAAAVREALVEMGHDVVALTCELDLAAARSHLELARPDLVFNLVESLDGRDCLVHLFPALLDAMKLPYTGCSSWALLTTTHKITAKIQLHAAGLPTPAWCGPYPSEPMPQFGNPPRIEFHTDGRWIVKSLWEHASFGLEEDGIVRAASLDALDAVMKRRAPHLGGACFAERFVDGREFNLSLLADDGGPRVLPVAEIIFDGYGEDRARIVGYRAKWQDDSFEYHHTPRRFGLRPSEGGLQEQLEDLAVRCWQLFGLSGYARVDFRVDSDGCPWILEVNANPCLSPDAGFAAALEQAGISLAEAVEHILVDAGRRQKR